MDTAVESELPTEVADVAAPSPAGDAVPAACAVTAQEPAGPQPVRAVHVAPEQLRAVLELYEQGQMLRAYELARSYGALTAWRGPGARALAGRLAENLGAPRVARVLHR